MGNVSPTPHQLLVEACVFWSIGVILYVGRMVSRVIGNGSFKRLFFDDYVMTVTFLFYTGLMVLIQVSAQYATNLMDPADYESVLSDPQEVKDRIFGSKIVIGLEQCMLLSTWGVKTCMLAQFWRLTKNLKLHLFVKIIVGYVALGFVVIQVTYFAVYCRPFSQYWAMPVSNMQCATYQHYSITQAVFNISSDAAMLAVPVPLLIKAQMKRRKKVLLVCIMSLGIFTVIAAILNKYFNFASPLTTIYQIWYIREASTAMYVANLMCLWPLLRKVFGLKAFQYNSKQRRRYGEQGKSGAATTTYGSRSRASSLHALHFSGPGSRKVINKFRFSQKSGVPQRTSEEAINKASADFTDGQYGDAVQLGVLSKSGHQSRGKADTISDSVVDLEGQTLKDDGLYMDHARGSQSSAGLYDDRHATSSRKISP
ncbi:hypothetical protein ASPWEDRAFT_34408 [Aspergillus wentii DTO 134E9]|uniref:Rhodopsin domain-containing protein n=1 Tax=Aspergillus wentii DTO 134E9 TaxID=1073089 RepID=A0A1L9S1B7_ASPWE|nr:uncharacterized protein ASPWEDRAFT_34408 [Aspergillus wentii DTO 134E9]KAI9931054.1 hypothetical protein MW887_010710 [Aspergillus wentii]OJJ40952.1 hypothetical protein ASPWEDRAFT_34408 [Aspergillus wentii DTO 134E9]